MGVGNRELISQRGPSAAQGQGQPDREHIVKKDAAVALRSKPDLQQQQERSEDGHRPAFLSARLSRQSPPCL
jgi:hypothetical protein